MKVTDKDYKIVVTLTVTVFSPETEPESDTIRDINDAVWEGVKKITEGLTGYPKIIDIDVIPEW